MNIWQLFKTFKKGIDGSEEWSFSTVGDVMQVQVGDMNCNGKPNIAAVTFGSQGVIYAFRSLATGPDYVCGDANGDETVNVGDVVYLIAYIFKMGPPPDPIEAGDANGDGDVNVGDAVYEIAYIFKQGPEPICP